jgi:hypothetical protein
MMSPTWNLSKFGANFSHIIDTVYKLEASWKPGRPQHFGAISMLLFCYQRRMEYEVKRNQSQRRHTI